jgi:hypothetical protein
MESLAEAFSSAAGRSMNAAKDEKPSDRPGQH